MTQEQEDHMERIGEKFVELMYDKYEKGAEEHKGLLWKKKRILDMAIEESLDMVVYLFTLKEQLDKMGIEPGELDE